MRGPYSRGVLAVVYALARFYPEPVHVREVVEVVGGLGVRSSDLHRFVRVALHRLVDWGVAERVSRGVYRARGDFLEGNKDFVSYVYRLFGGEKVKHGVNLYRTFLMVSDGFASETLETIHSFKALAERFVGFVEESRGVRLGRAERLIVETLFLVAYTTGDKYISEARGWQLMGERILDWARRLGVCGSSSNRCPGPLEVLEALASLADLKVVSWPHTRSGRPIPKVSLHPSLQRSLQAMEGVTP